MNKQIEVFPWNNNFNTGIQEIDEQHKSLVKLLNSLANDLARMADREATDEQVNTLKNAINALADYAKNHFTYEENTWGKYFENDDWLIEHEKYHAKFINYVEDQIKTISTEFAFQSTTKLLKFLIHWLAEHILENDLRMSKVVFHLSTGKTLIEAKLMAQGEMGGLITTLIDTILNAYDILATNTLELSIEKKLRNSAEKKVQKLLTDQNEIIAIKTRELDIILNHISIGVAMTLHRHMMWVNQELANIFGYSVAELIDSDTKIFFTSQTDWKRFGDKAYDVLLSAGSYSEDVLMKRKNGTPIWIKVTGSLIESGDQSKGAIWLYEDISMQKEFEAELIASKTKAEQLAKYKSEFLANMSHEIRTPMNGIIGLTELILNEPLTSPIRDKLSNVLLSSKNLLGILNDILDFSKLEAGKFSINPKPFSVHRLCSELNLLFKPRAEEKEISFNISISLDIPNTLIGDELRIRQILSNLISNAIKFTDKGEVNLNVKAKQIKSDQDTVFLSMDVSDSGIGISQDKITNLFNPFEQADETISTSFGGTGLGLNISKQLLTLMGGEISVTSQSGIGSKFIICLPLKIAPKDFKIQTYSPKEGGLATGLQEIANKIKHIHVLIAEDNKINQQVVTGFLNMVGISSKIAHNGCEMLSKLKEHDFDVILSDIQMPEMDGLEATKKIRINPEYSKYAHIPIIALSADILEEDRLKTIEAGMNGFVGKPINPEDLLNTIISVLKNTPQKTTSRSEKVLKF